MPDAHLIKREISLDNTLCGATSLKAGDSTQDRQNNDSRDDVEQDDEASIELKRTSSNGESGGTPTNEPASRREPIQVSSFQPQTAKVSPSAEGVRIQSEHSSRKRRKLSQSPCDDPQPASASASERTAEYACIFQTQNVKSSKNVEIDSLGSDIADSIFKNPGLTATYPASGSGPADDSKKLADAAGVAPNAPPAPEDSDPLSLSVPGAFDTQNSPSKTSHEANDKLKTQKHVTGGLLRHRAGMATMRYGQGDVGRRTLIGRRINDVLGAANRPPIVSDKKDVASQKAKPTHPFFLGKVSKREDPSLEGEVTSRDISPAPTLKEAHNVISFSTPGKMIHRANVRRDDRGKELSLPSQSRSGAIFRIPGTADPPWPGKNFGNAGHLPLDRLQASHLIKTSLKRKSKMINIRPEENIVAQFSSRLFRGPNPKSAAPSSHPLQHPTRLVMSGTNLQARVRGHLKVAPEAQLNLGHPRLLPLFGAICDSMSSFDKAEYENIPWTQKYAPNSTSEVLQAEREMRLLRDWLKGQTVTTTDSGVLKQHGPVEDHRKNKRKRARRFDDLDGFIVDGDDDTGSMRDLSDEESTEAGGLGNYPRSLVTDKIDQRNRKNPPRTANAVLLSGPPGCGKTAAAFAAAKELGFDIFEIGPGTRRSGKDILDKVGDMALNHQVSKSEINLAIGGSQSDDSLPSKASEDQSTLGSFFSTSRQKKGSKIKSRAAPTIAAKENQKSRQKQSLILLEEVDVLFEQDKQFWETVVDLAMQSKRPIIMTCNDENLVPLTDLSLYAILRFRPLPESLAANYLLLLAAVEGHLLRYDAVASLYRFRGSDLRASIVDLDFWCQMAIGDRKGGMEWSLERWPPGVDLDEHNQRLRVVSADSLVSGQGILSDNTGEYGNSSTDHERKLAKGWAEWNLEPSHASSVAFYDLDPSMHGFRTSLTPGLLDSLIPYDDYSSLLSAVDVFGAVDLPRSSPMSEVLDPTGPPMQESERANFTDRLPLLQADVLTDYTQFDTQATLYMHSRIAEHLSIRTLPIDLLETILDNRKPSSSSLPIYPHQPPTPTPLFIPLDPLRDNEGTHPSCLDTPASTIAQDVAPYIRAIAAYDAALLHQQSAAKTGRKTRASRSAMEGSQREVTRRERWFSEALDLQAVLGTGGAVWSVF